MKLGAFPLLISAGGGERVVFVFLMYRGTWPITAYSLMILVISTRLVVFLLLAPARNDKH